MRMKARFALLAAAMVVVGAMTFGVIAASAATTTVKVTAADLGNHWFPADTRPPGTGTFEFGPATPPNTTSRPRAAS